MSAPPALPSLTLLAVLISISASAADPAADAATGEAAARAAIARRLDSISSIRIEYDVEETYTPIDVRGGETKLPDGGLWVVKEGTERSACRFCFLGGVARWEQRPSAKVIEDQRKRNVDPIRELIEVQRPDASEQWVMRSRNVGWIGPPRRMPLDQADLVLGLRDGDHGDRGWFTPDLLAGMNFERDKDGRAILWRANHVGQRLEFVFDPKQEYALVAYRRYDKESGLAVTEATAAGFQKVNGVLVPFILTYRTFHTREKRDTFHWRATLTKCDVNSPANDEDHYYIAWPSGTRLGDTRPGKPRQRTIQNEGEKIKD